MSASELLPPSGSAPDEDPFQSEEYQRFVAAMAEHCQCRAGDCPCDGVLAGGPCDMIQDDPNDRLEDDDE